MTEQILNVTAAGEFQWHEDADRLIAESDFSNQPAMKHILVALREYTRGSIYDLPLSNRSINALLGANITSVSQLRKLTRRELLAIQNLGKVCAKEIEGVLEEHFRAGK